MKQFLREYPEVLVLGLLVLILAGRTMQTAERTIQLISSR